MSGMLSLSELISGLVHLVNLRSWFGSLLNSPLLELVEKCYHHYRILLFLLSGW